MLYYLLKGGVSHWPGAHCGWISLALFSMQNYTSDNSFQYVNMLTHLSASVIAASSSPKLKYITSTNIYIGRPTIVTVASCSLNVVIYNEYQIRTSTGTQVQQLHRAVQTLKIDNKLQIHTSTGTEE